MLSKIMNPSHPNYNYNYHCDPAHRARLSCGHLNPGAKLLSGLVFFFFVSLSFFVFVCVEPQALYVATSLIFFLVRKLRNLNGV